MEQLVTDFKIKDRRKHLRLDEEAWKKVKIFVDDYFRQPDKAANATYPILFRAISEQYPNIVLGRTTFNRKVGSIEDLKVRAGIQTPAQHLSKEHRSRLKDRFLQELIGLPLHDFESIGFAALFERAHNSDPDLRITEINKNTLAFHFLLAILAR